MMTRVTLLSVLLFAAKAVADGFLYPDASAAMSFRIGDTVNVSWTISYSQPYLELFCGYVAMPLLNVSVADVASYQLSLTSPSPIPTAYANCYLQIIQGASYIVTPIFAIGASNGSSTHWSESPPAPPASGPVHPPAAAPASPVQAPTPLRPAITLTSDSRRNRHTMTGFDCWNNQDDYNSECWDVLNLDKWLAEWFLQTPQCRNDSHINCNAPSPSEPGQEAWTTTFLREAEGPGSDCTLIPTNGFCSYAFDPSLGSNDLPLTRARYKYVSYSIYGINAFFNTWYTALTGAVIQAQDTINDLIKIVDPIMKTHVKLNDVLTALTIAVSFIPVAGPELAETATLGTKVGDLINKGIKQAPGVAQAIWPASTEDSQDVQFDALTLGFSNVSQTLRFNMQLALSIVQGHLQTNVDSFLAFASNGSFAVPLKSRPSVLVVQQFLLQSLTTYLASVALSNNGWHILMRPSVNPQGLTNGTTQCPSWAGSACEKHRNLGCTGYDLNGQCNNYWWYSASQNAAYTLNHNDNTDSTQLIGTILNSSWATGASLFEDAAVCEVQSVIRQSLPAIYTTYEGHLGFAFNGSFASLRSDSAIFFPNESTFLPIDGSGLSALSQDPALANLLYHPNGTEYGTIWQDFGPQGFDFRCTSQLNVTIANSWDER